MKFVIMLYPTAEVLDALSPQERTAIGEGHRAFVAKLKESGEFVGTLAMARPDGSTVVRAVGGAPAVTGGPFVEAKEFVGGFYLLEVADRERAHEIAAMVPDAAVDGLGVEVRPVVFSDGAMA